MRSNFGERGTVYSHAIVWGLEVLQPAKFLDHRGFAGGVLIVKKPSTVPRSRFDGDDEGSVQLQVEDASTDRHGRWVGASLRLVASSNSLVLSIVPHLISSCLTTSCLPPFIFLSRQVSERNLKLEPSDLRPYKRVGTRWPSAVDSAAQTVSLVSLFPLFLDSWRTTNITEGR